MSEATPTFSKLTVPAGGAKIAISGNRLVVPDNPIIPVIRGDGTGRDIMKASKRVLSAAVEKTYKGKKKIVWFDVQAGEDAMEKYHELLPEDTVTALRHYVVSLKGPLTTPVGGGFRSINVALRQILDLYACVRPCQYIPGIPSPVKHPEKVNMVVFREATEDVYAGIEWQQGTPEAKKIIDFLNSQMNLKNPIRADSGIGVKPISVFNSKRLTRKAIQYAIQNHRKSVTFMHKGNIMKFTEGAFRDWGYELGREEFGSLTIREDDIPAAGPGDKIVLKDRIADSIFQQILTRPDEYEVIATPNLNGDYLSDALAAQVGGIGIAPGGNINYVTGHAIFEATHGTAPKYADQDKVNPGSVVLSGVMMLEHMGWGEAAALIVKGLEKSIANKTVTYDFARLMEGAREVKCSEFGDLVIKNM